MDLGFFVYVIMLNQQHRPNSSNVKMCLSGVSLSYQRVWGFTELKWFCVRVIRTALLIRYVEFLTRDCRRVCIKFMSVMLKNSIRTSQETHYVSATNPNRLILFRETVAVYCENHRKHTNTVFWENPELRYVKACGTYKNHRALKG
jgi:hypothetical protein